MDEEIEKPFPIELIVILMIVAIGNDIAEIFFDILSATGVGIAGEAIMEPANLVLDFFFTGIFIWKGNFGGPTITQYIDDLLQLIFIPGRTISVGLGLWIANNPNSAISRTVTAAVELQQARLASSVDETEGAVGEIKKETEEVQKTLQKESVSSNDRGEKNPSGEEASRTTSGKTVSSGSETPAGEGEEEDSDNQNAPENDVFKNPLDNPVGTAGAELNEPSEEEFQEGKGFGPAEEPQQNPQPDIEQPKRGIHLVGSQQPAAPKRQKVTDVNPPEELAA